MANFLRHGMKSASSSFKSSTKSSMKGFSNLKSSRTLFAEAPKSGGITMGLSLKGPSLAMPASFPKVSIPSTFACPITNMMVCSVEGALVDEDDSDELT